MKTVQQVINEADLLVPNVNTIQQKIDQLNNITNEFYNNVKIPEHTFFNVIKNQTNYTITGAKIKEKDIENVQVGFLNYRSNEHADTFNTGNRFTFNDSTNELVITPPYTKNDTGIIRHYRCKNKTYTSDNMNEEIDAPEEFQQTFVNALASWIALTQDDITRASIYEANYRSTWNAASQNYGS